MRKYPTGIFIYFAPLLTLINESPGGLINFSFVSGVAKRKKEVSMRA
jgi:hypothetical protein